MVSKQEYQYKEAFCLMVYRCRTCEHEETIWNSRDGITPFCSTCPSCGLPDLVHVEWGRDRCAPDHKPHHGQRIWASMTEADVRELFRRRRPEKEPTQAEVDEILNQWGPGGSPVLRIHGYEPTQQATRTTGEKP